MATNTAVPNFSLYWAGWKTNLYELAKAGWTINLEENHYDRTFSLAIQNHYLKVVGLCNRITDEFIRQFNYNPDMCRGLRFEDNNIFPTLQMQYLSFKIAINVVGSNKAGMPFTSVDEIYPHMVKDYSIDITTLIPQSYTKAPESEIIVPEYTIPELMNLIKEKQAPRQKEIRDRLKKETNPNIKVEAKIISVRNNDLLKQAMPL